MSAVGGTSSGSETDQLRHKLAAERLLKLQSENDMIQMDSFVPLAGAGYSLVRHCCGADLPGAKNVTQDELIQIPIPRDERPRRPFERLRFPARTCAETALRTWRGSRLEPDSPGSGTGLPGRP